MLRSVFSLSGFNRAVALATGFAGGYAFTNPDVDTVYDIFPLHKPPPYAFLNVYKVKKDDFFDFEQSWKEVARFNQRQEGYLFTKLMKVDTRKAQLGEPQYQYIDITQWTTGDAQRRATLRPSFHKLKEDLQGWTGRDPMMYSVVVDDTPSKV
mmetsp:Transcript_87779/g.196192  ORF Transcript_87779/g.196192 Transcript_87779/m.196192 type:complete len:153 (-) Transcript_87779:115-573(-)